MSTYLCALFALLWLLPGQMAMAAPSEESGQRIAQNGTSSGVPACASCHGTTGLGNSAVGFPRLAGLSAPYLLQQLDNLGEGSRSNAMMSPIAKLLSSRQKQSLADWYADLPVPPSSSPDTGSEHSKPRAGSTLATTGLPARNIPACDRCHGVSGSGVGDTFPSLAGQSEIYLENQLINWKEGNRPAGAMNLMPGIASQLTRQQIQQIADYYAHLPQASAPQSGHQGAQP